MLFSRTQYQWGGLGWERKFSIRGLQLEASQSPPYSFGTLLVTRNAPGCPGPGKTSSKGAIILLRSHHAGLRLQSPNPNELAIILGVNLGHFQRHLEVICMGDSIVSE